MTTRTRTTQALTGTTSRTSARFDHDSVVTLSWASRWLHAAGGLHVPASGILRRALAVYAQHLEAITDAEDQLTEAWHTGRACAAPPIAQEEQNWRDIRLEVAPPGTLPPPLADVLHGPGWAARVARLEDTAEAIADQCLKRPRAPRGISI